MHRFFLKPEQIDSNQVFFRPEETKQIRNVLRLSTGAHILVLDNKGNSYKVEISKFQNKTLKGTIIEKQFLKPTSQLSITLGQALTKGSKIDFIIQKATEIGVQNITLIETERSIVKYKDIKENRLIRWEKIAKESAEQSHRLTIPAISICQSLSDFFISNKHAELKLIFWEEEKEKKLRDCLKNAMDINSISIVVGPEGGFSQKEIDLANKFCFSPVWLGPLILKTETAALSILSIIQYVKGELG